MQVYILAQGYGIRETIEQGYDAKSSPDTDENGRKLVEYDVKAKNAIMMSGLTQYVYVNVLCFKTNKELWGKLQNIYEGDSKVKEEKIQICKA